MLREGWIGSSEGSEQLHDEFPEALWKARSLRGFRSDILKPMAYELEIHICTPYKYKNHQDSLKQLEKALQSCFCLDETKRMLTGVK